ncbi:MFS transporter [Alkalihalophilus marmarensis]|jgi:MFS family permease|uniref:MFS transporter n=1 Tax=Alkalihalophilus marmarensis DSM 21297 TaxID=1188261 RepID=U6SLZ0_9BACI|nr:MFS transporter [Alkalihalophilus marmarensis]ERN52372.1 MFS transporter [Alkalihalophilus marmarensis DSM 21297]MCM3487695.1 MFS transporter [Alkalihalophilus marmarensis]
MPKALWLLVVAMVINVTGASFLWPLNAIIIHQELGRSLTAAGFILMLNAFAGVIGNLIGGRLFDKIGAYRTMILSIIITTISATILAFFHSYYFYMFLLMGLGFGSGMMFPAMYALAGSLWPEGGRKPFNAMYVAQNVGVALGTALVGIVASIQLTYVFSANAAMYAFLLVFVIFAFRGMKAKTADAQTANVFEQKTSLRSNYRLHSLLLLSVAFFICWVAYTQWQANVSVHTQSLGISLQQYSLFWTVNGLMIVFAQPVVSWLIKKGKMSLKGQMIVGVIIFMASYIVLSEATIFSGFLAAMIILTFGEMFVWPAVPTIANDLAPKGKEGFYQGIVNSVSTGGKMIGPLLGGMLVDFYSMTILIYVLLVMFGIAIAFLMKYDTPIIKRNMSLEQEEMNLPS